MYMRTGLLESLVVLTWLMVMQVASLCFDTTFATLSWLATHICITVTEQMNEHTNEPFRCILSPVDYFLLLSDCHPIVATFLVKHFISAYIFYRKKVK